VPGEARSRIGDSRPRAGAYPDGGASSPGGSGSVGKRLGKKEGAGEEGRFCGVNQGTRGHGTGLALAVPRGSSVTSGHEDLTVSRGQRLQ